MKQIHLVLRVPKAIWWSEQRLDEAARNTRFEVAYAGCAADGCLSLDNAKSCRGYPWLYTSIGTASTGHFATKHHWLVGGDLKALKRHYPKVYANLKARGLLLRKVGKKWEDRSHA